MDPNQENVRKRLLLLIVANSKKEMEEKKKICERKGKKKKSVYTEKNPIPVLIFDRLCITEINLIQSQKKDSIS
jgi:hypothetical protein